MIGLVVAGLAACSIPPPSANELLRKNTPAQPVLITGRLQAGGQASFGDTSAVIEEAHRASGKVDLTANSIKDALALIAATSADVEEVSRDIAAASKLASSHARVSVRAEGRPIARFEGSAPERVRKQADAVSSGATKLAQAAHVVAQGAQLALFLGAVFSGPEEPLVLKIAADSRGVPHRATCTTKSGATLLEAEHRSLSCVIVRADGVSPVTWYLSLHTAKMTGQMDLLPATRGWLRREPVVEGELPIWLTRPDTTTTIWRRTAESVTSFALQRDSTALAGIQLDYVAEGPKAWVGSAFADEDERGAVEVALAVLALVPWPEFVPEPADGGT